MIRVIVQYGAPEDPAAFDAYYKETHTPLAAKMPKMKSFEVSRGPVVSSDENNPVHLTAILSYDSKEDLDESMASDEGQAAVDDLANFATGGVTILTVDTEELL